MRSVNVQPYRISVSGDTQQTKQELSICRCLSDCPNHVADKREKCGTGYRDRSEEGHVYNAVHRSTSIPLLFPTLLTGSSLRQKRDILWILVLLAHCTHIVSVAEDEVLFFLMRGLRVLGGAWAASAFRCTSGCFWLALFATCSYSDRRRNSAAAVTTNCWEILHAKAP